MGLSLWWRLPGRAEPLFCDQFPPFGVKGVDQRQFRLPFHVLHLVLPPDGRRVVREGLVINAIFAIVAIREGPFVAVPLVLGHPVDKVNGTAHIEHRAPFVCHDVGVT